MEKIPLHTKFPHYFVAILRYFYKRARTHASARLSWATLDQSSLVARLAAGGYDLSEDLLGLFSVETAGGWLILYLKGSGLDSRLLAQRKSIVDVEVTQAAFKQTVGSHLSGIRVCVTWRRRCNSPQFWPQEEKVPEGFWSPCWRDFSRLLPTPLAAAAAHARHKLSTEQEVEISGHKFSQHVQEILSVAVVVGFVQRQCDPTIMF